MYNSNIIALDYDLLACVAGGTGTGSSYSNGQPPGSNQPTSGTNGTGFTHNTSGSSNGASGSYIVASNDTMTISFDFNTGGTYGASVTIKF